MKKIYFLSLFFLLFLPSFVLANGGLVPCSGPDCDLCHLFELFANLVEFALVTIVPPLGALFFMYGGIIFFTAGGNPSKVEKGKQIIVATLVGIVIIYGAHLLVSMILEALDVGEVQWPNIKICD